ncbi:MAG TPA: hypothetical protein ENI69_06050 [Rhodospirillales bacterium]|nr:hypothetical protein [Rhodospirillales bacterium]
MTLALMFVPGLIYATTGEAASLSGTVTVEGKRSLKNIVIYLEPAEGQSLAKDLSPITISQKDSGFHPAFSVTVAGTVVRFANDEKKNIDHNVYSLSKAKKFDIGLIGKNMVREVLFDRPGTIKFYCSIHKTMEGVLSVLPSPYFALIAKPGPFVIDQVPPGKWIVKAVVTHRRYGAAPVSATLSEGTSGNLAVVVSKRKRKKKKAGLSVEVAARPLEIIMPVDMDAIVSLDISLAPEISQ